MISSDHTEFSSFKAYYRGTSPHSSNLDEDAYFGLVARIYLFFTFIYLVCVLACVCVHSFMETIGQLVRVSFLFLPHGSIGLNASYQVWWQVHLLTESSHWPHAQFLKRSAHAILSTAKNSPCQNINVVYLEVLG